MATIHVPIAAFAIVPPFTPDPLCEECGESIHEDASPGVFVHDAGHDADADHVARPDASPFDGDDEGDAPVTLPPSELEITEDAPEDERHDAEPPSPFPRGWAERGLASTYLGDIPLSSAIAAHNGTSMVPERRGDQEVESFAATLASDWLALAKYATTEAKRATLVTLFGQYRSQYRARYLSMLAAKSRCMSTMITGGSNFPTARNRKRSDAADHRTTDALEYREHMLAKIKKALRPELAPIMAGDDNALERLDAKLAKARKFQEDAKAINAAIRRAKKGGRPAQHAALVALGYGADTADKLLTPDFLKRIGIPDYAVKNNGAEIRRLEARRVEIAAAKVTPASSFQGEHARLEECPADNRIRLFYPGKPDSKTRDTLKRNGFRWTPTLGCWQAYINHQTRTFARNAAGSGEVVS